MLSIQKILLRLTDDFHTPRSHVRRCFVVPQLVCIFFLVSANTGFAQDTAQHNSTEKDCVILLHGLARTASSMNVLRDALQDSGYTVANIDYPSRKFTVEELAKPAIDRGLARCARSGAGNVHVVTHSMGGILFRQYVREHGSKAFSRTVMLAPPNKGSEAVDALHDVPGFQFLNGPAGSQLGTGDNSKPRQLGPATSDVAIIAGTFSINLVLSTYLPDPDDGKVSVESTRLDGMCAHLQVHVSHPFIMEDEEVIPEIIHYLGNGRFASDRAETFDCEHKYNP